MAKNVTNGSNLNTDDKWGKAAQSIAKKGTNITAARREAAQNAAKRGK